MEPPCEHGGVRTSPPSATRSLLLQWSRRVNTAECSARAEDRFRLIDTSMEPPCEHGGVSLFGYRSPLHVALQWSRRVNTAECLAQAAKPKPASGTSMEPPCEHGGVASATSSTRYATTYFNGAAV